MHVRSDILLLVDEFEDFQNMCLEIYELDPTRFLTAPGLAWEAVLQKNKVRLDHLTEIDMLLMVKKGIRGGIFDVIHIHAKVNNKYIKDYNKIKESWILGCK